MDYGDRSVDQRTWFTNRSRKPLRAGSHGIVEIESLVLPDGPTIEDVAVLTASIGELGVLEPVVVTPDRRVLIGAQRVRRARASGHKGIEVVVRDIPETAHRRVRLEANYAKSHRSYARQCMDVVDWMEELFKTHPEKRQGQAGAAARWERVDAADTVSVASAIAKTKGVDARTIRRMAEIGKKIPRDVLEEIDRMPPGTEVRHGRRHIKDRPGELHLLTKHRHAPDLQRRAVALLKAGKAATVRDALSQILVQEASKCPPPSSDQRYAILACDPPWGYGDSFGRGRQAPNYATMSTEQIIATTPIGGLADDDAMLVLWVPDILLPDGVRCLQAWGFAYKGLLVWAKAYSNPGAYYRHATEVALVGTRCEGKPKFVPDICKATNVVFTSSKGAHSEKPDEFFARIDELYPVGRRIEVYARRPRPQTPGVPAWDGWGAEWQGRGEPGAAEDRDPAAVRAATTAPGGRRGGSGV